MSWGHNDGWSTMWETSICWYIPDNGNNNGLFSSLAIYAKQLLMYYLRRGRVQIPLENGKCEM